MAPPDPVDLSPLDPDDPDDAPPSKPAAGKPAGNAPRSFLFDDPVPAGPKATPAAAGKPAPVSASAPARPAAPARSATVAAPPAPRPGVPFSLRLRGGWSTFAWRCGAVYALLFCLPFPCSAVPWTKPVADAIDDVERATVPWLAQRIGIAFEVPPKDRGSGDTSYDWFWLACVVTVSLLLGAAWHLLRWNRRPGPRARDALRTFVRYFLGAMMLSYGVAKVIPLQFGAVDADTLSSRWGDASPMGVLWTFHALSPAYTMFTGLIEAVAGMLLCWRSTALLGALFTAAAMAQVAMLNFCYDVPVKILSTHLLAFALLLCVRDAPRLLDLFVRNRSVAAAELWPWWEARWLRGAARVVQLALVAWLVFAQVRENLDRWQERNAPQPQYAGTWQVETFARDGTVIAPFTSPARWTQVGFAQGRCGVTATDGSGQAFVVEVDAARSALKLSGIAGPERQAPPPFELKFKMPDDAHLELDGEQDGATLRVRCRRLLTTDFFLEQRGFHWITEFPVNRR